MFTLNRGQMVPEKLLLLDYRFDGIETWWPWLKSEDVSLPPHVTLPEILVPTKETNCISNWLKESIDAEMPVILMGNTGTGKSLIVKHLLGDLPKEKYMSNSLNLAANSKAQQVQELVMYKLDRRRKGVFGPPVGKSVKLY